VSSSWTGAQFKPGSSNKTFVRTINLNIIKVPNVKTYLQARKKDRTLGTKVRLLHKHDGRGGKARRAKMSDAESLLFLH